MLRRTSGRPVAVPSPGDRSAALRSTPPHRGIPELGFYTLAGGAQNPRDLVTEIHDAEALGLGAVFISERFNVKEAVTLSGAAAVASTNMTIITGATNHNTRHPIVTASYATTMHRLTGGRFVLGIGRGIAPMFDAFGIPRITTAQMEDFTGLMRRSLARRDRDRPLRRVGLVSRSCDSIRRSTRTSRSASSPSDRSRWRSAAERSTT